MKWKVRMLEKQLRTLPDGKKIPVTIRDWDEEFEADTKQKARKMARKKYPHAARYPIGRIWKSRCAE